ncbi:MAG TPA: TonB family protein [Stellaceae bacterium]|nr:TonB family protein [Stellaceae bacterium]
MSETDLSLRIAGPSAGPDRPARIAIALALLLHVLIALWLLFGWGEEGAPEPPAIEVTLVTLPPPAPPAPPPPAPQPPQKQLSARQSGPDEVTTAAPHAAEPAPAPETPPPAAAPSEAAKPPEAPPVATGLEPPPEEKPKAPTPPTPQTPKPKLALRAPNVEPPPIDRILGEKDATGDPYLNALWSRIERNRKPTTPVGPAGLHLEGTTVFKLLLDRGGRMDELDVVSSSGSPLLDEEARRMIVAATPFPAPPADYPERIPLRVTIHLFPQ